MVLFCQPELIAWIILYQIGYGYKKEEMLSLAFFIKYQVFEQ